MTVMVVEFVVALFPNVAFEVDEACDAAIALNLLPWSYERRATREGTTPRENRFDVSKVGVKLTRSWPMFDVFNFNC